MRRTPEKAALICTRIAEGFTLRQIARQITARCASEITKWAREDDAFALQYARAKEAQADHFAEEILAIADDSSNDWMEREAQDGTIVMVPNHEHINRSRLRVDSRKWLMSKMAPKKYGETLTVDQPPTDLADLSDEQLLAIMHGRVPGLLIEHEAAENKGDS
jgi:hypothetical protein